MEATKSAYLANMGKKIRLGRFTCEVCSYESESRYGSWERGFKWTRNTYGYLKRKLKKNWYPEYSFDHGRTWNPEIKLAKKTKGKIKLDSYQYQEFAFEGIQEINRKWDAGYKWRP